MATLGVLVLLTACGPASRPFGVIESGYQVKPSSMAVLAGDTGEADMRLAEFLTAELQEQTRCNVLSQAQIRKRVPKYPMTIETETPENPKKPVWIAPKENGKLDALRKKLQVDYLFVVWTFNLQRTIVHSYGGGSSTNYSVTVLGNLIDYPSRSVVSFTEMYPSTGKGLLTLFKKDSYFVEKMLKGSAASIASSLARTNPVLTAQK
nr:hypothetical protein [Desulfuromonadales bacterium]